MASFSEKQAAAAARLGIDAEQMPRHIAIIMDGNGRWAQRQGKPRSEGHRMGGKTVENVAQHCVDLGVESLTIYSFSTENWKRPKMEIEALMYLYERYLVEIRPTLMKNNVKLVHIGRAEPLPAGVRKALDETLRVTAENTGMRLVLALNYSGRMELTDAVRAIGRRCAAGELDPELINERTVSENLYTTEVADPDLLIRTANELRVSNFLLWQISYSEFYVTGTLWPDFGEADLEQAILVYAKRVRRFGEVK